MYMGWILDVSPPRMFVCKVKLPAKECDVSIWLSFSGRNMTPIHPYGGYVGPSSPLRHLHHHHHHFCVLQHLLQTNGQKTRGDGMLVHLRFFLHFQPHEKKWPKAVRNFPRLLITAHSNSAVQQLQQRTSAGCFVDRDGCCLVTRSPKQINVFLFGGNLDLSEFLLEKRSDIQTIFFVCVFFLVPFFSQL